jgi:hypothetical protein
VADIENGDDASRVRYNGWRQGSVASLELTSALREAGWTPPSSDSRLLVLSHDCDVLNSRFSKEPWVELGWLEPVDRPDGLNTRGKNVRLLHLPLRGADGREAWFELGAHSRFAVERRLLCDAAPSSTLSLPKGAKQVLASWLAKRYDRSAFPDAFNRRLPKNRPLTRALTGGGAFISQLYLGVADQELAEDQPYDILLRAVMTVEDFGQPERRTKAENCLQELEGLLGDCAGIEVLEAELVSEAEVTLDDLRVLKRWDFDWLSVPQGQD